MLKVTKLYFKFFIENKVESKWGGGVFFFNKLNFYHKSLLPVIILKFLGSDGGVVGHLVNQVPFLILYINLFCALL